MVTVLATPSDITVPEIHYGVTLKGIKLNSIVEGEQLNPIIYIIRSLGKLSQLKYMYMLLSIIYVVDVTRPSVRGPETTSCKFYNDLSKFLY